MNINPLGVAARPRDTAGWTCHDILAHRPELRSERSGLLVILSRVNGSHFSTEESKVLDVVLHPIERPLIRQMLATNTLATMVRRIQALKKTGLTSRHSSSNRVIARTTEPSCTNVIYEGDVRAVDRVRFESIRICPGSNIMHPEVTGATRIDRQSLAKREALWSCTINSTVTYHEMGYYERALYSSLGYQTPERLCAALVSS